MTDTPSASPVTIVAGEARATLEPAAGGRLTSWCVGSHELIVPREGRRELWWGAFPMAPWTSIWRAGLGSDLIDGRDAVDREWHGVARRIPWSTASVERNATVLGADLAPHWRPGGSLAMSVQLGASTLRWEMVMTGGQRAALIALGWHPWFPASLDGHAAMLDLPSHVLVQERTIEGVALPSWKPVAADRWRAWDDCIVAEWPIRIEYGAAGALEITASSRYATIFHPEGAGVCVEPVTSPAEFAWDRLGPGESVSLTVECRFIGP